MLRLWPLRIALALTLALQELVSSHMCSADEDKNEFEKIAHQLAITFGARTNGGVPLSTDAQSVVDQICQNLKAGGYNCREFDTFVAAHLAVAQSRYYLPLLPDRPDLDAVVARDLRQFCQEHQVEEKACTNSGLRTYFSERQTAYEPLIHAFDILIAADPTHFSGRGTVPLGFFLYKVLMNQYRLAPNWIMVLNELHIDIPSNILDERGRSILHELAAYADSTTVKLLIDEHGGDAQLEDIAGRDVLDYALEGEYIDGFYRKYGEWFRSLEALNFLYEYYRVEEPRTYLTPDRLLQAVRTDDIRTVFLYAMEAWDFTTPLPDGKLPLTVALERCKYRTATFLLHLEQYKYSDVGATEPEAFGKPVDLQKRLLGCQIRSWL